MTDLIIRASALLLFISLSWIHHLTLGESTGFLYYGSAALFDLFLIFLLSLIKPVKFHVLLLQVICLAFVVVNFIGWVMWYLYLPPIAYNAVCHALYVAAIIAVVIGNDNGRGISNNKLHIGVCGYHYKSGFNHLKN